MPVEAASTSLAELFELPRQWPSLADVMGWCQTMQPGTAAILIAFGFIFLIYGSSFHRVLIALNSAAFGAWLGGLIGTQAGAAVPGAMIGGFVGGCVAWPMIKQAVSAVAGIIGFVVGASLWRTVGLSAAYAPAGGLIGAVFLFMLSFITFRTTLILATGLQGAAMLIFGTLGMLYKYQDITPRLDGLITANDYVLPMSVLIPAILGVIYQHSSEPAPAKH
jgi:hypothetical protein